MWKGFDEGLDDGILASIVVTDPPRPVQNQGKDNRD
jgi:hypothetical protein